MWQCNNCGEHVESGFEVCWNCEASKHDIKVTTKSVEITKNINSIILTTAPFVDGYVVEKTLEIITSECVYGLNLFSDFFAAMTDTFGGRSETTQKALKNARKTCLAELKKEAAALDADAVIAVRLDYSEFSGKGKSMLFLVASGTAVKLLKIPTTSTLNSLPSPNAASI